MSVRADDPVRAKCIHPSGKFVKFANEDVEQSIPERFAMIARRYPDRIAVKTKDHALTFAELEIAANGVAQAILAQRAHDPEPVALLLSQDVQAIVAILGVLKSGKFYVPMDPSLPREKSQAIIQDSGSAMILCDAMNLSQAHELAKHQCSVLDVGACRREFVDEKARVSLSPESLACILYTSGSTGEPKGVIQSHRNLLHWTKVDTNLLRICPEDRLTWLQRYTVASCLHNLLGSLLNGAALCPFDPRRGGRELARWLREEEITIYHSVAMVFRQLAESLAGKEELPSLRLIRLSGTAISAGDVDLYRKYFSSSCILVHVMGTTETGTFPHFFIDKSTPIPNDGVPVGYAAEGGAVNVIDENGRPVAAGQVGEIVVKSHFLSPGYWRQPELTQERFLPDPDGGGERVYRTGDVGKVLSDGSLMHLGRRDFQANVRGYRVETGEVEKVLSNHPLIEEAVVCAQQDDFGESHLVAYFVPTEMPGPMITALQSYLSARLASYMIPSKFLALNSFPRLASGKVDRNTLPPAGHTRPNLDTPYVGPRDSREVELAKIWTEALSLDDVGVDDDFLALGGNSLQATRIVSRVMKHFGLEIPLKDLFQAPTVAEMAAAISRHEDRAPKERQLKNILDELDSISDDDAMQVINAKRPADPKT